MLPRGDAGRSQGASPPPAGAGILARALTAAGVARLSLALILFAGLAQLPERLSFLASIWPVLRLMPQVDAQNRAQFPGVPYDLLRASDAALPRGATVLLVTPGQDVRHLEYTTYHRALYLLAPRPVWWLAPAPPDGTWESRWWLSAPVSADSIRAAAASKGASYVLLFGLDPPPLLGRTLVRHAGGTLLQLSEAPLLPAGERAQTAGSTAPLQAAAAAAVLVLLGSVVVTIASRLGMHPSPGEGASLSWAFGSVAISLGMLWLNALGAGLHAQVIALAVVAGVWLGLRLIALRRRPGREYGMRPIVPRPVHPARQAAGAALLAVVALSTALVTIAAAGRPLQLWDSWVNWAMKSRSIYLAGGITPTVYADASRAVTMLSYPLLVPLNQAWLYAWLGAPDDRFAGVRSAIDFAALVSVVYFAARRTGGTRLLALAAATALAVVPLVAGMAQGALAEIPLLLLATVGGSYLWEWLDGAPPGTLLAGALAAGAMPWVKMEGILLLAALVLAALASRRGRRAWAAAAACALCAALIAGPWWVFSAVRGTGNPAFVAVTPQALQANLPRVAYAAWREGMALLSPQASFVWVPVALLSIAALLRRTRLDLFIPLAVLLYLAALPWIYIFSSYAPYQQHVLASIDRLAVLPAGLCIVWLARAARPGHPPGAEH